MIKKIFEILTSNFVIRTFLMTGFLIILLSFAWKFSSSKANTSTIILAGLSGMALLVAAIVTISRYLSGMERPVEKLLVSDGVLRDIIRQEIVKEKVKLLGEDFQLDYVSSQLNPLLQNCNNYINISIRNSIVNLLIGIIGTAVCLVMLYVTTIQAAHFTEINLFLINILPKIAFIAL